MGFEIFNMYISGILLFINTGSFIVTLVPFLRNSKKQYEMSVEVVVWYTVTIMLTTLNTAVNRRHLMVWPIFAPKYLFEAATTALGFIVTLACLI
jgi:hypothetical protein